MLPPKENNKADFDFYQGLALFSSDKHFHSSVPAVQQTPQDAGQNQKRWPLWELQSSAWLL